MLQTPLRFHKAMVHASPPQEETELLLSAQQLMTGEELTVIETPTIMYNITPMPYQPINKSQNQLPDIKLNEITKTPKTPE
jgi:hypothetical protein